ncbi:MAG: homoserine kinase [Actinomycetota bacterium]
MNDSSVTTGERLRVRVPASTANLGPGFDVLGMAVSLHALVEVETDDEQDSPRPGSAERSHPGMLAFRSVGGRGSLSIRCPILSGRGLGFSGAVRVGGVCLGLAQRDGVAPADLSDFIASRRNDIMDLAADLEGHGDNVAASLFGGVTAVVPDGRGAFDVIRVPLARRILEDLALAVWVPNFETSTAKSRGSLSDSLGRDDAVFNIAHTVRVVTGLVEGDLDRLRSTLQDRMHQDERLRNAPLSRRAMETMLSAGASTAWLSGSGPTVASLCEMSVVPAVRDALGGVPELSTSGRAMSLAIDEAGLQAAR